MQPSFQKRPYPVFRPRLEGCVLRDTRMANELNEVLCATFYAVAANTYRSLICQRVNRGVAELLELVATDDLEHFRLLADLILALGGNPALRTQVRIEPIRIGAEPASGEGSLLTRLLRIVSEEKRRASDRYQSLMGQTQDRVVRSVLSHILYDLGLQRESLASALG